MDATHTNLELVGVHVPDANSGPFSDAQQAQAAGYDTLNPVTGTYQIGVVIEGAFVPLISEKASLVFDKIALAASQQPAPTPAPQAPPAEQPSAMQTGEPQAAAPAEPAPAEPAPATDQPQA